MFCLGWSPEDAGIRLSDPTIVKNHGTLIRPVKPRLIVLDPPFAVMMKRKNAPEPYFVAWIGNADLLGGD